jgi:hypothetical protein
MRGACVRKKEERMEECVRKGEVGGEQKKSKVKKG